MRPAGGTSPPSRMPGARWAPVPGRAYGAAMRVESSVLSVSWIPSEAIKGVNKLPFEMGMAHYDEPPPDVVEDLAGSGTTTASASPTSSRRGPSSTATALVASGAGGGGSIGSTTLALGPKAMTFEAVALPDLSPEPEVGEGWVRFRRTAGRTHGRPDAAARQPPALRQDRRRRWRGRRWRSRCAPTAPPPASWSGPAPSPATGSTARTAGSRPSRASSTSRRGSATPSARTRRGATPTRRRSSPRSRRRWSGRSRPRSCGAGSSPRSARPRRGRPSWPRATRARSCSCSSTGCCGSTWTATPLAELGPGALLGERAVLEGGRRTASLVAVTACKVAVASAADIDREALRELSEGHRREERRDSVSQEPQPERSEA